MGPVLSSLVNLQKVENELRITRSKLNKGKQGILRQQHAIRQLEGALEAKQGEIKISKMNYDRLDLDLKTSEADIAKMRVALNSAKTNKEYSAVLTRINTDKADLSKLEDKMLQSMAQIETDQSLCSEIAEKIVREQEKLKEIQQRVEDTRQGIQGDIERLEASKDELSEMVPSEYRDLFARLAERYDGEVLATISNSGGKKSEQSCGGCYMSLPLEVVNKLMTKDIVICCPNCGRIMVMAVSSSETTVS